jgi:hypothetical protein
MNRIFASKTRRGCSEQILVRNIAEHKGESAASLALATALGLEARSGLSILTEKPRKSR